MKHKILFVCMGNICRSPAAEGIFLDLVKKRGLADDFLIDSAGTYGGHLSELPDNRMRLAASKRNYNLYHRSRQLQASDFEKFDKILIMDGTNHLHLQSFLPDMKYNEKVFFLADYCKKNKISEIPDPYYSGARGFDYVLDLLEDACENLLEELVKSN
jgi:protein-tyrosine phosphatase